MGYPEVVGAKQVTNSSSVGEPGLITGSSLGLISSVTMEMSLILFKVHLILSCTVPVRGPGLVTAAFAHPG